jgi:hypothetical protein
MLQKVTNIFHWAGGRAFRFSCFAGSFSGNVRQVASSGRSCRPAVKVTCFNKLPLQSLPVRAPTISSFLILLFGYSLFIIRFWILDIGYWILDIYSDFT